MFTRACKGLPRKRRPLNVIFPTVRQRGGIMCFGMLFVFFFKVRIRVHGLFDECVSINLVYFFVSHFVDSVCACTCVSRVYVSYAKKQFPKPTDERTILFRMYKKVPTLTKTTRQTTLRYTIPTNHNDNNNDNNTTTNHNNE